MAIDHADNLAIVALGALLIWLTGILPFLAVHLAISVLAGAAGIWLFYVQHQFEDTHWSSGDEWQFEDSALHGASNYDLPRPLQWLTGNIGIHHVHHLASRVPFYRLPEVLRDHHHFGKPALREAGAMGRARQTAGVVPRGDGVGPSSRRPFISARNADKDRSCSRKS